ncbi:MAG: hypothetical protein ACNA8W_21345, partial [Bradymonadaceae bacterium]
GNATPGVTPSGISFPVGQFADPLPVEPQKAPGLFETDLPLPPDIAEESPFSESSFANDSEVEDLQLEKVKKPRKSKANTTGDENVAVDLLRLGFFTFLAIFGLYVTFIISATIFDKFLDGSLKLIATCVLAIAIPLTTALGENSQKERFHVVTRPVDRLVRVCIGSAIISFMSALLITIAMSGTVTHQLRYNANWFLDDESETVQEPSGLAKLNYEFSTALADMVETSTRAIGIYEGVSAQSDSAPTANRPPAPTRPSTRPTTGSETQESEDESVDDESAAAAEDGDKDKPATPRPRPSTKDDGDYVRW